METVCDELIDPQLRSREPATRRHREISTAAHHAVLRMRLASPRISDSSDRTGDRLLVVEAIKHLSDDHRVVLFELYHRRASLTQAAQALGVPPVTIKSRTHDALRALRAVLHETGRVA